MAKDDRCSVQQVELHRDRTFCSEQTDMAAISSRVAVDLPDLHPAFDVYQATAQVLQIATSPARAADCVRYVLHNLEVSPLTAPATQPFICMLILLNIAVGAAATARSASAFA